MAIEQFDVVDLIRTKRDRGTLSTDQINWLIDAYTRGYVADEQMSAMNPRVYASIIQSICAVLSTPRSRLVRIRSTTSKGSIAIPPVLRGRR